MQPIRTRLASAQVLPRISLVLRDGDGEPWRLEVSAGMEPFIGAYPRLAAFAVQAPLLQFKPVRPLT
jgi:hypothetical protein